MKTVQRNVHFPLGVEVTYNSGAYVTQTIAGQRTSCTHSDQAAVTGLVKKLTQALDLQPNTLRASKVGNVGPGRTLWRIKRTDVPEAA